MKLTVREICAIGMFAAIISVLSILQIPSPSGVPFTLQTFAIVLCGFVLGSGKGVITTGLYILLGAFGLPVFSGMKGGIGVLLGPTGGYLIGFIFLALCSGRIGIFTKKEYWKAFIYGALGIGMCHLLGVIQLKFVLGISISGAFLTGTFPYLWKDIIMMILAVWVGKQIKVRIFR